MRTSFLIILTFSFLFSNAITLPVHKKKDISICYAFEPCTATISDTKSFYVYNCGGNTYGTQITGSCSKTAPTCREASAAAINCTDAAITSAGAEWGAGIRRQHCPQPPVSTISNE